MIRLRSQKLMSGVSTLAVLASFGMADPLLAAGTDVNGPGNVPAINTQTTNDLDYIDIDTNANVGATGGNSILNNAGTILGNTAGVTIRIDDSVLQGAITNNGSIGSTGATAIDISNSNIVGGVVNNGRLSADGYGLLMDGNSIFSGGITNTGTGSPSRPASTSAAASSAAASTTPAASSRPAAAASTSAVGVDFSGGINNCGTIEARPRGHRHRRRQLRGWRHQLGPDHDVDQHRDLLVRRRFTGGINNSDRTINGRHQDTASIWAATSFARRHHQRRSAFWQARRATIGIDIDADLVQGGINNSDRLDLRLHHRASTSTVSLFQGGVTNSGVITSQDNCGLDLVSGEFQGGINNTATGTIVGDDRHRRRNDTFIGGITNAGLIQFGPPAIAHLHRQQPVRRRHQQHRHDRPASTAIAINGTTFNGGITNSGSDQSDQQPLCDRDLRRHCSTAASSTAARSTPTRPMRSPSAARRSTAASPTPRRSHSNAEQLRGLPQRHVVQRRHRELGRYSCPIRRLPSTSATRRSRAASTTPARSSL